MKRRMTISMESANADYLAQRAARETDGNVSALVERMVQQVRLAEAVAAEAAWYAAHPSYAEEAEAERRAAGTT